MYGKYKSGIIQLLTLGGLGIWSIVDLIVIANQKFKDSKENLIKCEEKKHFSIAILISIIVIIIEVLSLVSGFKKIQKADKIIEKTDISKMNVIKVFMYYDATEKDINSLEEKLKKIDGIDTIQLKTKEDAYEEMQEKINLKEADMKSDMFSVSFVVTVNRTGLVENISKEIEEMPEVRNVTSSSETIQVNTNIKKYTYNFKSVISCISILEIIYIIGTLFSLFVITDKKRNIV